MMIALTPTQALLDWPGGFASRFLDDGSYLLKLWRGGRCVAEVSAPTFDEAVRRAYSAAGVAWPEVTP